MAGRRLGKRQLANLAATAHVNSAIVVPDQVDRTLRDRGLFVSLAENRDAFFALTPAGYRAIADALEAGAITRPPLREWGR